MAGDLFVAILLVCLAVLLFSTSCSCLKRLTGIGGKPKAKASPTMPTMPPPVAAVNKALREHEHATTHRHHRDHKRGEFCPQCLTAKDIHRIVRKEIQEVGFPRYTTTPRRGMCGGCYERPCACFQDGHMRAGLSRTGVPSDPMVGMAFI